MRGIPVVVLAILMAASAAVPRPAAAAPRSVLPTAYVPDDADLAVLVRMDQLIRTDLWRTFADSQSGLYRELTEEMPLKLDPERDVRTAVLALKLTYEDDGEPDEVEWVLAMSLSRTIGPEALLGGRAEPARLDLGGVEAYRFDRGAALAMAAPRLALAGSDAYLKAAIRSAATPAPTGPADGLGRIKSLPGQVVFAGRMPPKLRGAVGTEFARLRERRLRSFDGEDFLEFAMVYGFMRACRTARSAEGRIDLARDDDALAATVTLDSERSAGSAASWLGAMIDPLAIALPAMLGGRALAEPPDEPIASLRAEGSDVHVTAPRAALEWAVAELVGNVEAERAAIRSMDRLLQLGRAVFIFHARRSRLPASWSELLEAGLIADADFLRNPRLDEHFADYDYALVPLSDLPRERPHATVLAYERWHGDGPPGGQIHALFADGHVERLDFDRFRRLLAGTHRRLETRP